MKPQPQDTNRDHGKTGPCKLGGLALLLGAGTWVLSSILLPARLPDGFPKLPDVQALNLGLRSLLVQAGKEARAHPRAANSKRFPDTSP